MSNKTKKSRLRVPYLVRRETHSARALLSVSVAFVLIVALGYLVTEGVLALSGQNPLIATPGNIWKQFYSDLNSDSRLVPITVGALLTLCGALLLTKSVLPGALSKHALNDNRVAYVVDDAVIASGVSRLVREKVGLPQGAVTTAVSKHRSLSTITPNTGQEINHQEIQDFTTEKVTSWNLHPRLTTRIKIDTEGRLEK